jgi:hypothetical protein
MDGNRALSVMAGLVPAIHAGPPRDRFKLLTKLFHLRRVRFLKRSIGSTAWMAGTSLAMTAADDLKPAHSRDKPGHDG